jgi:hypothetical protein
MSCPEKDMERGLEGMPGWWSWGRAMKMTDIVLRWQVRQNEGQETSRR